MNDCLFCRIVAKEIPAAVVHEDGKTLAFLDIHPVNPGHVLVVPKEHAETMLAASHEANHAVLDTVQRIAPAVLAAVGAPGMNLGVNCGSVAGQAVMHYHLHIMPRFEGDGRDLWHGTEPAAGELDAVAAKIRAAIG